MVCQGTTDDLLYLIPSEIIKVTTGIIHVDTSVVIRPGDGKYRLLVAV